MFVLSGCFGEPEDEVGARGGEEQVDEIPEEIPVVVEYVKDGQLTVNGVLLSPEDLHVTSAFEVSAGLWEFQAQGQSYRVIESNPNVVVWVPLNGRVTLILVSGQSLAMGASSGNTVDPSADIEGFTGRMLMPAGFNSQGPGDRELSLQSISKLAYLKNNSGSSHSPATSAVYHALTLGLDASFIVLSHGIDGKQIEYLRDGNSLANGIVQLQASKALVESYGLKVDYRIPVIWNQGESDGTDVNYFDDLSGLLDLYKAAIKTHFSADHNATFLIDQVSRVYSKAPALAQYQVCDSRDDSIMVLTKAHMQLKYNMAVETGSTDKTHMSKRGYYFMGAYWGKAVHGLLTAGDFNSLDKHQITVEGEKIHIDFMVGDSHLVHDSQIDVGNLGFSYSDDQSTEILNAEIVSSDRVTLVMSKNISEASSRVLGLGREVEASGNYTGSPLRTTSPLLIPELGEYLHDWALCWEVNI